VSTWGASSPRNMSILWDGKTIINIYTLLFNQFEYIQVSIIIYSCNLPIFWLHTSINRYSFKTLALKVANFRELAKILGEISYIFRNSACLLSILHLATVKVKNIIFLPHLFFFLRTSKLNTGGPRYMREIGLQK